MIYKEIAVRWLIPLVIVSLYCVCSHRLMFLKQNMLSIWAYNIYSMHTIHGVDYGTIRSGTCKIRLIRGLWVFFLDIFFYNCPRLIGQRLVVGRCSHLALACHRCPYPASDQPSSTHHPVFFSIRYWLDIIYKSLRLLVALPQEVFSKEPSSKGPCRRLAKTSSSLRPV